MSILNDNLFDDKLKELQRIEKELQDEKDAVHIILGQWLVNALDDDKNNELRKLFIDKYDDKKYLSLKRHRSVTEKIANNLKAVTKTTDSNHANKIANDDKKSETVNSNLNDKQASFLSSN